MHMMGIFVFSKEALDSAHYTSKLKKKKHQPPLGADAFKYKKLIRHIRDQRYLARAFDCLGELPLMSGAGAGGAAG